MHVVVFEGIHWRTFAPFSLSRPVFMLPCGAGTLLDKQLRATKPTRLTLWVRPGLEDYCRRLIVPKMPCPTEVNAPLDEDAALLLSGRTLHLSGYEFEHIDSVVFDEGVTGRRLVRHAQVHMPGLSPSDMMQRNERWKKVLELPTGMPQARLPQFVWDLINWNEEAIVSDSIAMTDPSQPKPAGSYHLINENDVWLGANVKLGPGCVLDASRGAVILADEVSIGANAVLQGPCYIGPHTQVTPLSLIRGGTSTGPMCKIGGEISNSILNGFVNKAHHGFLGDSCIGEWVNLAAGTTTSNLKNTYGEVSMTVDGHRTKSGRRFLGSLIGDHTKTAIGTNMMTGSYAGFCTMIGCSKHPPKFIPSFTFLTDEGAAPYRLDKAQETMKAVFTRRGRVWNDTDRAMNEFVAEQAKMVEKQEQAEKES
jgi:UDP-N-acetylglucosamine diphosphorylase/glucosamine-1-phosphate N-acetyltransferase